MNHMEANIQQLQAFREEFISKNDAELFFTSYQVFQSS